ncbi:RNA polymerase sigma factor [Paenibacillus sp. alder61]|uniref:RNA polymerase sigma factor n=1 Tax=Paenibacillus sp. alder61 TaxID=2862948 RepID=UPI001CD1AE1D|nr:RNA polymerase sigma factor [Paenibacillus sp. alder61]MCA1293181.1 RNA polymerase sigma factor [Paenibacillus sp. alder61]
MEAKEAKETREQIMEEDLGLVERARQGDTEAFGVLIERHRDKAHGIAERMTGDPHMADDIVQDALIRAFMHVGSLVDASRFLPWFHRIVRNQANMRLRRGGPYRKEKPLSAWDKTHAERVDWENLDSILGHLTRSASEAARTEHDPAEHLLRKELYETIRAVLHCLTRKEQSIFEDYFFRQLSPDEIAAMHRMPVGSIYTYLHRSRRKLREEHVRLSLGLLPEKEGMAMKRRRILDLPPWPAHAMTAVSLIDRIGHLLAALGDPRDTAELMGLSGFAFRMKISNKTTFADGIYVYDWRMTIHSFLQTLGYPSSILCGQLAESPVPLLAAAERFPVVLPIEEALLPFIRKYVELGRPVLYFDTFATKPYVHEWALIYGYDDEAREVLLTDAVKPEGKRLSYDDLAENPLRFLVGIDGEAEAFVPARPSTANGTEAAAAERVERTERAIREAVRYSREGCEYRPMTGYLTYTSGLAAYDRWIGHLQSGHANRYGMGQLAFVYADTKRYAADYLRRVPLEGEAMRLALLASEAYEQAAASLAALSKDVPFIRSTELLTDELRAVCISRLTQAKEFETAAVGYLEKAICELEKEK